MIIGSKEKFGISVEFTNSNHYVMGFVQIWLNYQFLGSDKEEIMLTSFVNSLDRIVKEQETACEGLCLGDVENEYHLIQLDDLVHDHCLSGLGEAFDDFEILFYRRHDVIRFIWKLYEDPFHDYPGYGHSLRYADIAVIDIVNVLEDLHVKVINISSP